MSLGWATSEEAAGCFWGAWTGQLVAIEVEVGLPHGLSFHDAADAPSARTGAIHGRTGRALIRLPLGSPSRERARLV